MTEKLAPGTKVMVYDVSLKWGCSAGYVAESEYTRQPYEVAVRIKQDKGLYWVHRKQLRVLTKKRI